MNSVRKEFQYGNHTVVLEANRVAKQATGSVLASMGDTVVLCTAVVVAEPRPDQGFFPLTVNYEEKMYAIGKIPGGFPRREGRPTEKETLTCRLIDRPIRPLFPKGFMNEVQLICTVMSVERDMDPDIVAMIGASAALSLSGAPFGGPIGAARVGYMDGTYVLNPGVESLATSALNMVVAGTAAAVLMVESEADELSEDQMLGGVLFAQQEMQVAIQAIEELTAEAGKPKWDWQPPAPDTELAQRVEDGVGEALGEAYRVTDKQVRQSQVGALRDQAVAEIVTGDDDASAVREEFARLEKGIVRNRVIEGEPRIDGRDQTTVRPITVDVGLLPRTHGSAMFTRGETQAIVTATLGTLRDAALMETLHGTYKDQFMLHYNFPPYSVGETAFLGGPKRREIGHGALAERALINMIPEEEIFPYTLRVVSDILESNGSSSMATVCGASLALMDAGVPIKAPVAGVAMGLVMEGDQYAILTDIAGAEDHFGDMDFKVAGTSRGITALQMDIKVAGITPAIMAEAMEQARKARLFILDKMLETLPESRTAVSLYAPRIFTMKISTDKIRDVIGPGGKTIRSIIERTGVKINVEDDGRVNIASSDESSAKKAIQIIHDLTAVPEVGKTYLGKVVRLVDFGAFVEIIPGTDGLLHISEVAEHHIKSIRDELKEGDQVLVKVLTVEGNRIKLSRKAVLREQRDKRRTGESD